MATLAELRVGDKAVITGFSDEILSLKLLEMGCLPGTVVELIHTAPFGDPIALKVSGYTLSMRKDEASTVKVKECKTL